MPNRLANHSDIFTVIMVHLSAIGVTFLHIENALKIASLVIAILYTAWKWRKEWKASKND